MSSLVLLLKLDVETFVYFSIMVKSFDTSTFDILITSITFSLFAALAIFSGFGLHIFYCPYFECSCACWTCTTPVPHHTGKGHSCPECTRPQHCPACCMINRNKCNVCAIRFHWCFILIYYLILFVAFILFICFVSKRNKFGQANENVRRFNSRINVKTI